jgi:small subunit ribosomal protein S8e
MGITRSSFHKRRATGGRLKLWRKKRKFEMGRQPSNTRLGTKRVHEVRCRGGLIKQRALRLEHGNYSWGSETITRKTRILDVVYNASNNELVRTKTLVKGAIVQIDATPFRQWYNTHYGVELGKKKDDNAAKVSHHVEHKRAKRAEGRVIDAAVADQFKTGRVLARISSRPGQCGRSDGYVLEGRELEFYLKKMHRKKGAAKQQ